MDVSFLRRFGGTLPVILKPWNTFNSNRHGRTPWLSTVFPGQCSYLHPNRGCGCNCHTGLHNILCTRQRTAIERFPSRCSQRERLKLEVVMVHRQYRDNCKRTQRAQWTFPNHHRHRSQGTLHGSADVKHTDLLTPHRSFYPTVSPTKSDHETRSTSTRLSRTSSSPTTLASRRPEKAWQTTG